MYYWQAFFQLNQSLAMAKKQDFNDFNRSDLTSDTSLKMKGRIVVSGILLRQKFFFHILSLKQCLGRVSPSESDVATLEPG